MAEGDELVTEDEDRSRPWKARSAEEHAAAFIELLGLVEATGRVGAGKARELQYPVIARSMKQT